MPSKCLKEHATALLLLASLLAVRGITNVANLTNELVEAVLDIDAKLGRRLEKRNAPRAGKVLALGLRDLATVLEIALVADQDLIRIIRISVR